MASVTLLLLFLNQIILVNVEEISRQKSHYLESIEFHLTGDFELAYQREIILLMTGMKAVYAKIIYT